MLEVYSILSSYCPKCKKFLTPDIKQCPACGFDRKKFYKQNFYIPSKERAKLDHKTIPKGLSLYRKLILFLFPPLFISYLFFLDLNSKQIIQSAFIVLISLALDAILLMLFADQIRAIYEQQQSVTMSFISRAFSF